MAIKKRPRLEPTHEWQQLALLVEGPEQRAYEVMRPCVLFGQSPAERARQTGVPWRKLYWQTAHAPGVEPLNLAEISLRKLYWQPEEEMPAQVEAKTA